MAKVNLDLAKESSIQEVKSLLNETKTDIVEKIENGSGSKDHGFVEYTTAGTYTWTCPNSVREVIALIASGGGGGGGGDTSNNGGYEGGGGASGCIWCGKIFVTSGETYNIVVGAGGSGGSGCSHGSVGGTSKFGSFVSIIGGAGGKGATYSDEHGAGGSIRTSSEILSGVNYHAITEIVNVGVGGKTPSSGGTGGGAGATAPVVSGNLYNGFSGATGGTGGMFKSDGSVVGNSGGNGKIVLIW